MPGSGAECRRGERRPGPRSQPSAATHPLIFWAGTCPGSHSSFQVRGLGEFALVLGVSSLPVQILSPAVSSLPCAPEAAQWGVC